VLDTFAVSDPVLVDDVVVTLPASGSGLDSLLLVFDVVFVVSPWLVEEDDWAFDDTVPLVAVVDSALVVDGFEETEPGVDDPEEVAAESDVPDDADVFDDEPDEVDEPADESECEVDDDPPPESVVSACATPAPVASAAPKPNVTAPAPNQLDTGKRRRPFDAVVDCGTLRCLLAIESLPERT
jgi:hypothetical protein